MTVQLNLAHRVEQAGAAVSAIALRAKMNGLLVDRKEIGGPGAFADLSDEERKTRLLARVAQLSLLSTPAQEIIAEVAPGSEPAPERAAVRRVRRLPPPST